MPTKEELEQKVDSLSKELEETKQGVEEVVQVIRLGKKTYNAILLLGRIARLILLLFGLWHMAQVLK